MQARQAHTPSYYAASAHAAPERPALNDHLEADVAIVGGGFTGVASALSLAERGYSVVLLEANRIGWGASGRNGGQVLAGWSGESELVKQLGPKAEEFLWKTRYLGNEIVEARLQKYDIKCDYTHGAATVAFNAKQMKALEEEYANCVEHGAGDVLELVDGPHLRRHAATDAYIGGLIDRRGAHCHPLNLLLGEAAAAEKNGVKIFEGTQVTTIDHGPSPAVQTENGSVRAKHVILAGNAYHLLEKDKLRGLMLPAKTYVIATAPLGDELAHELLPDNLAICDSNWVLDYFRLTGDKRLLFGGRCTYSNRDIEDIEGELAPRMRKIFPQLQNTKVDFGWGGVIGIPLNRVPLIGKVSDNVFYAQGYAGHGVNCSHIVGEMFADAIRGKETGVDLFDAARHFRIPAADAIGGPMLALGMTWYRMRDALGV
ncbi:NAD(P)/FAD-dependent oxidoreductase [Hyphococcus sp.]|uniref:NAD(P)/FAD-dependent oxidoreductase n=1 Tax=Hyphococcus sp. TaxID=2038636 RepID=UPI0035C6B7AB